MKKMFKKEGIDKREIIKKRAQFIKIFKKCKRIDSENIRIYFTENENEKEISRFSVVTGKKLGKAVLRNRVKRIIKEVYRKNKEYFGMGINWIFIPQGKWEKIKYNNAERLILDVIKGIKKKKGIKRIQ
ncbi:MAG: ribonuclease P protein component [bacterium]